MRGRTYTREQLELLIVDYQKRLSLCEWEIELELLSKEYFEMANSVGSCAYNMDALTATIKLPETMQHEDHKRVLIHELLHLVFPLIGEATDRHTLERTLYEQGFIKLERVLVDAFPDPEDVS